MLFRLSRESRGGFALSSLEIKHKIEDILRILLKWIGSQSFFTIGDLKGNWFFHFFMYILVFFQFFKLNYRILYISFLYVFFSIFRKKEIFPLNLIIITSIMSQSKIYVISTTINLINIKDICLKFINFNIPIVAF